MVDTLRLIHPTILNYVANDFKVHGGSLANFQVGSKGRAWKKQGTDLEGLGSLRGLGGKNWLGG